MDALLKFLAGTDLVFIRHAKTAKAVDDSTEADRARKINAVGEVQCAEMRRGWMPGARPVRAVLHSEAGRTVDTARLLLADDPPCPLFQLDSIYFHNFPELDAAFDDYLPLRDYKARVAADGFKRYADLVVGDMAAALERLGPEPGGTVIVVSHAVYVSAVAEAVAVAAGCGQSDLDVILDANVGEVSGFRVSLNPPGVTYLGVTL